MRKRLRHALIVIGCVSAAASGRAAQSQTSGATDAFAGRWEIQVQGAGDAQANAFAIVELATSPSLSAKVIDALGAPVIALTVKDVSAKDGELTLVLQMGAPRQVTLTFRGRRVGDHLAGTAAAEGEAQPANWTAVPTTKDKLTPPVVSDENRAYSAAMSRPAAQRTAALQQFLKDYPDAKMKESATLQIAELQPTPAAKIAALQQFVADFPKSPLKETAYLQMALANPPGADRTAALHKFLDEHPASPVKDQAAYELIDAATSPADRIAAEEDFVKTYPTSGRRAAVYQRLLEEYMHAKPVDEAKLGAAIDGYIAASPDMTLPMGGYTMNMRANAMNTVADRLMTNEVMLDRALDVIQQAVEKAGDKEEPSNRAVYVTTLGQVLFKLHRYDDAERELKRASAISHDVDGDALLYLGKIYEARKDDAAALDAYLQSVEVGATADGKASLQREWTKVHGSANGLEEKLDALYRARPKPFDPGTFTRPAGQERVVLAELFTGAECVPCIAQDLAFDGVAARYDRSTVAVLVYHLHIPAPDPMTNADTEARAKYYAVRGTPTPVIDGTAQAPGGGNAAMSGRLFDGLKAAIEPRLAKAPRATLSNFHLAADGATLTVTGRAELAAADGAAPNAVLHLALVEDEVRYVGANGIRFHSFVVRSLLGSPEGTPLTAGTPTSVSERVDVNAVSKRLDDYLKHYEATHSRPDGHFTFSEYVDHLDPKSLMLVAFVQDDATKEILQAVVVDPKR